MLWRGISGSCPIVEFTHSPYTCMYVCLACCAELGTFFFFFFLFFFLLLCSAVVVPVFCRGTWSGWSCRQLGIEREGGREGEGKGGSSSPELRLASLRLHPARTSWRLVTLQVRPPVVMYPSGREIVYDTLRNFLLYLFCFVFFFLYRALFATCRFALLIFFPFGFVPPCQTFSYSETGLLYPFLNSQSIDGGSRKNRKIDQP